MKNKIIELKNRIDQNIEELQKDIGLTKNISDDIKRLLDMNAHDDFIKNWIQTIDDVIFNIETKLIVIESDKY